MTSWTEILKANKGLHARDSFSELWGLKLKAARAEFHDYTITGTLPLSFNARVAGALKNYRIYGTSAGSGTPTESGEPAGYKIPISLESGVTENLFYSNVTQTTTVARYSIQQIANSSELEVSLSTGENNIAAPIQVNIPLYPGTYTLSVFELNYISSGFDRIYLSDSNSTVIVNGVQEASPKSFTINSNVTVSKLSFVFEKASSYTNRKIKVMLTQGSTAPDHYIPHRYTSNYDLMIGSTKLGAEEYVDYQEQKVYKRTENLVDISMFTNGYTIAADSGLPVTSPNRIGTITPVDVSNISSVVIQISNKETVPLSSIMYSVFNGNTLIRRVTGVAQNAIIDISSATSMYLSLYGTEKVTTDDFNYVMLVPGSTPPDHYIPYLQPTDPPAPLPAIPTYKGENTLDSTEMLGDVSITGQITEMT